MPPPPTIDALPQAHAAARKDDSIGGATSGDPPFATSTSGSGGGDAAQGNSRKGKGKGKKRETTSTPTGELTPPIAGPARKHNKGKTSPYSSASASALTSSPPVPVQPISSSSRSSNGAPDLRNPMIAGIYEQFRNNLDYSMSSDGVSTSGIGDAQSVSSAANSLYVQDTPHPAVASYRMAMEDHKAFDMDENAFVVDVLLGEERPSPSTSTEEHRP